MKKSKIETAATRKKIVDTASALFRRDGIQATGLAEIMKAAELTHGGFYRHFDSKDQLVAEAFDVGSESLFKVVKAVAGNKTGKRAVKAIADNYLSIKHRDDPAGGCPFASLGSEVARADTATQIKAADGYARLMDAIVATMPRKKPHAARSEAIFMISALTGALMMSRMIKNPELSALILAVTKNHFAHC